MQYNRNKLSIDVAQITIGKDVTHSANQWTAYQGLSNKITEYDFFTITGYENEANTSKENYIKSKSELTKSKIMSLVYRKKSRHFLLSAFVMTLSMLEIFDLENSLLILQ